jgi:hypothetical protein
LGIDEKTQGKEQHGVNAVCDYRKLLVKMWAAKP